MFFVFLNDYEIVLSHQPPPAKKIPEPIKTSRDVETRKQTVHTTLIRDQNGLGFSIAGGKGSPPYKDKSDVRKRLIGTCGTVFLEICHKGLTHIPPVFLFMSILLSTYVLRPSDS
jgi:hypothetical protein